MDWKKILSKLHLSLSAVVLAIAGFFLVIAAPVQLYDQWVVNSADECAKKLRADLSHKIPRYTAEQIKKYGYDFSPPRLDELYTFSFTSKDTGRHPLEDNKELNDGYRKKCHVTVRWYGPGERWIIEYHRLVYDEDPDPALMLKAGLFFIGLALLLFALKKWTIWLAS